jgi:hypothetical protein
VSSHCLPVPIEVIGDAAGALFAEVAIPILNKDGATAPTATKTLTDHKPGVKVILVPVLFVPLDMLAAEDA